MAKCKKETVEAALIKLIQQITTTMPNNTYKFILGGATTFATLKASKQIELLLSHVSDELGLVDLEMLLTLVNGAFNASDGKLLIELFSTPGLLNMFVKPLTLTIQKSDIDVLIDELKHNSVCNEVSLSPEHKLT